MATYRIKSADGSQTYNITLPAPSPDQPAPQQPYRGQILPFSKDEQGNVSFDSDAGLLGVVKRAVTFPADAMRGKVDPKSDEGIARAAEAAVAIPMPQTAGLGWAGIPMKSAVPAKVPPPTAGELKSTGSFGFNMAREMDVRYDPAAVQTMVEKLRSQLHAAGFRETNAGKVYAELDQLARPAEPGAFASIDDLHAVRMALQKAAKPVPDGSNAAEVAAASKVIDAIDDFITKPDPASVVAGPATAASGVWDDAMGNYAAAKRSTRLYNLEESAGLRAASANSGQNIENLIRRRAADIVDPLKPQNARGFTQGELALIESVARGTATRNTLRYVGNMLGGGGGPNALIPAGVGGALGSLLGPVGAAAGVASPGLGYLLKSAASRLTKKGFGAVDEATRMRSPLYEALVATAPKTAASTAVPATAGRAGLAGALAARSEPAPYSPIDPRMEALVKALVAPQMTPEQIDEYTRQKWAPQQGT